MVFFLLSLRSIDELGPVVLCEFMGIGGFGLLVFICLLFQPIRFFSHFQNTIGPQICRAHAIFEVYCESVEFTGVIRSKLN